MKNDQPSTDGSEPARQDVTGNGTSEPQIDERPQRRYPRVQNPPVVGSLTFRTEAQLVDISKDGVGVEAYAPLPPRSTYRMTIRNGGQRLELRGKSIWSHLIETREADDGGVEPVYRAGLRLEEASPNHSNHIKEFLTVTEARPVGHHATQRYRPTRRSTVQISADSGFVVRTISRAGALLETESFSSHGSTLELSMMLPTGYLDVVGRLVQTYRGVNDAGRPCTRIAVEFEDLSGEGHRQIESLTPSA